MSSLDNDEELLQKTSEKLVGRCDEQKSVAEKRVPKLVRSISMSLSRMFITSPIPIKCLGKIS